MLDKYANNLENPSSNLSFPLKRRRPDKLIQLTRDGYKWRKYGRKTLMDKTCVRSYYKCTHAQPKCPAKKFVDLTDDDYDRIKVTYVDEHNHPMASKTGPEKTPGNNTSPGDSDETFSQDSNSSAERNPEPQNSTSDEKGDAQARDRVSEVFPVADTWNTMTPNEHSAGAFQANYSSSALTDSDLTAPTWMTDVTSSSLAADLGFDFELPFDSEFRAVGSTAGGDGVSDPFSLLGGRNTVSLADFMFPSRTTEER